jgi:hypothetical protein
MTGLMTSNLTDAQLVDATKRLLRAERNVVAELVIHLADIEIRSIHLAAGFPSLYAYCVEELQLGEQEALNRIEAARAGRTYPRIFAMLADGSLSLTTAQLVARKVCPENHEQLLSAVAGRTKKEVLEVLARFFPQPDVPSTIRRLPAPHVTIERQPEPPAAGQISPAPPTGAPSTQLVGAPLFTPRAAVTPLAPDRYKVTFTADSETCELLEFAKDMLSHALPGRDTAIVVKRALKELVSDLTRRKFAVTERPRQSHGPRNDQDVSAAVKREVWERDRGRCRFVGVNGRRCESRRFVEFHHLISRTNGGKAKAKDVELRCGPHNRYEYDLETDAIRRRLDEDEGTRAGTSRPAAAPVANSPAP